MDVTLQKHKAVAVTPPNAIYDNTSLTCATVDTLGFGVAMFDLYLGGTDIAMTAYKIQESDDDSTYTDVTGAVYGTSTDIFGATSALPTATDDNKNFYIYVNLSGRKRYLKAVATAGNGSLGSYACISCKLFNNTT